MSVSRSYTRYLQFGASHQLKDHAECHRVHGHSYHVALTWEGLPVANNFGFPMSEAEELSAIGIVYELRNRHLNDMLPASFPSASGIAAYLLERTTIHGVMRVEVHESDTNITGSAWNVDR